MPPISDSATLALLAQAQAGCPAAFEALVDRPHRGWLTGVARTMLGDSDLGEQFAQDSLARAWVALPTLRDQGRGVDLEGWLATIVRHRCLDELRRRQRLRLVPLDLTLHDRPTGLPSPEAEAIAVEDAKRLHRAMATLSRRDRLALILFYVDGLSCEEAATVVWPADQRSCRRGGVKSLLHRARERLRAAWRRLEEVA